jgi:phenylpropionate dioxygenase-like ring-hydroxylating dioxygenase large terminal subunit
MVCVARTTKVVHANWKHQFENFSDSYHVPFVHKSSLNFLPVKGRELHDPAVHRGNYVMHAAWFNGTRGVLPGQPVFDELDLPEHLHGTFYPWIYPNSGMAFNIDVIWVVEIYPVGPGRFTHARSFLVPKKATERPDFAEVLHNYVENAEIVNREDVAIIEALQVAVRSPSYRSGRFATMDRLVYDCQQWLADHVVDGSVVVPLKVA